MPVTLQKRKAMFAATVAVAWLATMLSHAGAAPPASEDRYIAARDAAIEKLSPIYDAGKFDDAATAAEDAAARVLAPRRSISGRSTRAMRVLARSTGCGSTPNSGHRARKRAATAPTA